MPDTVISVGGDIRPLQDALARIEREIGGMGTKLKKQASGFGDYFSQLAAPLAGVVSVGAIKSVVDEYDRIGELSEKLGVTAESLQRVGNQAKMSGTDLETVVQAFVRLQKQIDAGDGKTFTALQDLGVDAAKLAGLAPEQQIIELAEAFQRAQDRGTGFSQLATLFGKQFGELLPMLRKSRAELEQLAGIDVVSEANVAAMGRVNDQIDEGLRTAKTTAFGLANELSEIMGFWNAAFETGSLDEAAKAMVAARKEAAGYGEEIRKAAEAQRKKDAAAAAEQARQASLLSAEKIRLDTAQKLAAAVESQLSDEGQLLVIKQKIVDLEKILAAGPIKDTAEAAQAAQDIALAKQKEAQLQEKINESNSEFSAMVDETNAQIEEQQAKEAAAAADKLKDQTAAQTALSDELAVLDLLVKGREKEAAALQKKIALQKLAEEIEEQTGMSPEDAQQLAKLKTGMQEKAEKRAAGKIFGGVSRISGGLDDYYANQREVPLVPQGRLRDTFTFSGLDKFRELQQRRSAQVGERGRQTAQRAAEEASNRANSNAVVEKLLTEVARNTEALRNIE